MGLFGPTVTREQRYAQAQEALRPYGFVLDVAKASGLAQYAPFTFFSTPNEYLVGAFGQIEGARVEAYEYEYTSSDSEGHTTHHDDFVVAIHSPWVHGGVAFLPDHTQWGGVSAALDTLFWIPPFIILKAFQSVMEAKHPDRNVGDAEFDRLYRVRAESDEAAARAIVPAFRQVCLRLAFRGTVEMRPGVLLYSPYQHRMDGTSIVPALGIGAAFLGALAPQSAHPMR